MTEENNLNNDEASETGQDRVSWTRKDRRNEIAEMGKSSELRDAENAVAEENVELTPDELRTIDESAGGDSAEREAMIIEAKDKKRQIIAMKLARQSVNKEVPSQHLVARPTYGPVTGLATYHTRQSFGFTLGRNSNEKAHIVGLFEAASKARTLVQGYAAGCPYAAWFCCRIEEEIRGIRKAAKDVEREAQALINHSTSLTLEPFTSKRPASVTLNFVVSYGFQFADLLTYYDRILRLVKSYELQHFIDHADFVSIERQLGTPLRRLFRIPSEYFFVGKDAVAQKTAKLLEAEHRMGILPDEFVDGSRKPEMV